MSKKLLLIGGGTIATHYKKGLDKSQRYTLCALADINSHCATRSLFSVPFYTDFHDALTTDVDVALISTSTNSHYDIAKQLLERNIAVITEKPMCETRDKVEELCSLAQQTDTPIGCMFHWVYADEVRYLKQHASEFGQIERITVSVCDDYAASTDGNVRADRKGLCGAWLDSGINILSYVGQLCDLRDHSLLRQERVSDAHGQEKYVHKVYRFGKTLADITVDWRTASREKTSEIVCQRGIITVNHTTQTVWLNGQVVYENPTADRLASHYENAFAEFTLSKEELNHALLLHRILFEGEHNEE